jgi:CheY-like chemotaxis protein
MMTLVLHAKTAKLRDMLDASEGPSRILLVEDEPLIQMLAVDFLEDAGLKIDTAGSAREALNKLALVSGGFAAVIVDIGLPDRSGDDLVREIRSMHSSLPIIVATGKGAKDVGDMFQGMKYMASWANLIGQKISMALSAPSMSPFKRRRAAHKPLGTV